MKLSAIFTSCIVALTSAVSCAAVPVNDTVSLGHFDHSYQNVSSLFDQLDQAPIEFKNCKGFDDGNAGFVVEEIGLSPNPPVRGEDLNITIKGELRQQMEQGARVKIKVWKWGVAFATLNFDGCSSIQGISCPVPPGPVTYFKTQDLDGRIPPWTFSLSAETFNKAGDQISCILLKAKVSKHPKDN